MDKNSIDTNIKILYLTIEETELLNSLAKYITINPSKELELYCSQVKNLCEHIPLRIKNILDELKNSNYTCILVKDFPIINNFKTPLTNKENIGEKTVLSKIQAILVSYISDLISYEGESSGKLFQDIVPIQNMSTEQSSVSSANELEIHTEQAFSKLRPDILSLACLRSAHTAFTYILPISYILKNITSKEYDLLMEPLWYFGIDYSFKLNNNEFIDGNIRGPFPIISNNANINKPYLLFDQNLITGITDTANEIIKKLVSIYYKYRLQYCLEPGDILLINNNIAVHGRSPFIANYDGNDRFLIRCFGTFDLNKSLYARTNNSRIIEAIYS
jgi:hypothetical protein